MNEVTTVKEKNLSINFIKAIACMCVVFIHTGFPGWTGQLVNALSRTAVAFFFVVAGYYSFNSSRDIVNKKVLKKLKDTVILAIFSILFYLAFGIFVRWVGTGWSSVSSWFAELFTLNSILELVLINEDIFAGHLWFVFALVYCYVAFWIINKLKIENIMGVVSVLLLVIHLLCKNFLPLFDIDLSAFSCRNAWFYGIPLFVLSNRLHYWMSKHDFKIKNLYLIISMPIWCGVIMVERIFLGNCQLFLGNILLVYTVFIWAIQNPTTLREKHICYIGEKCSMYIYIFHWAINNVIDKFLKMFDIEGSIIIKWLDPFIVLIPSLILALLLALIRDHLRNRKYREENENINNNLS